MIRFSRRTFQRSFAIALTATLLTFRAAAVPSAHAFFSGPNYGGSAGVAWSNDSNATGAEDNVCATTGANGVTMTVSNFGFAIPTAASVAGVKVEVKFASTLITELLTVELVKSTGTISSYSTTITATGTNCAGSTFLTAGGANQAWYGSNLTGSEVNNSGFGVRLTSPNPTLGTMYVDAVKVTVYYVTTVTISSVSPNPTASSTVVTWSADENGTYSVRVGGTNCTDGTVAASGTYSSTPLSVASNVSSGSLSAGTNTIRVCVTNGDNNTGSTTSSVYKDTTLPTNPSSLASTSHTASTWSADDTIDVQWSGASDDIGVDGYSIVWDTTPTTTPNSSSDVDHTGDPHDTTSSALTSGNSHYFHLRACDTAGNCAAAAHLGPFYVDVTEPSTSITAGPADGSATNSTGATFTFGGSDSHSGLASFECSIDGGAFGACVSPKSYAGLAAASHAFQVRAVDNVGNVDSSPASRTWLVDQTAPDTSITANPSNPSSSTTGNFTFAGTDADSGVASFQCQIDLGGYSACTSPKSFGSLSSASHTVDIRAIDNAGNVDASPATYTWVVDTTAPDTSITGNPSNPTTSTSATFTFTGSDTGGSGVASFECQLDGGGYSACVSGQNYMGLSSASHTFQVRAIDNASNVDASPASYTWVVDTVAPDTSITANPTNPSTSTSASFSFSGSDTGGSGVASFQCQMDAGGYSACTSPKTYTGLTEVSHTFEVRAIDNVGNVDASPASYTWTIDALPNTTITVNPTNPSKYTTATFEFTGTDPGSGVASFECQIDAGGYSACSSPKDYLGLTEATHTFQVRAIDNNGNVDASPASYTWTINLNPTITAAATVTGGAPYTSGTWTKLNVTVTFTCNAYATGATVTSCTGAQVVATDGGNQKRTGQVIDSTGRTATTTFSAIKIDSVLPVVTIGKASGTYVIASSGKLDPLIAATDRLLSKLASCTYTINGGAAVNCGRLNLGPGNWTVVATATDNAGNQTVLTRTYRVIGVSWTGSTGSLTLPTPVTATFTLTDTAPITTATGTVCLKTTCVAFSWNAGNSRYEASIPTSGLRKTSYPLEIRLTSPVVNSGPYKVGTLRLR